jgi:hypothetical protein
MKDKTGIIVGLILAIAVIATLALYIINIGTLAFIDFTSIAIVLILVITAIYIIWDRLKNVRKGLPAKDERLILISYKAGYYAFIAAIWSAVFGPTLIDIIFHHELEGHLVTALVVLVSGFVFMIGYLYLAWKGK